MWYASCYNNGMKLSLIVVSRNRAEKLKRFLSSVSAEEMAHAQAELILVDNNSGDDTLEVMRAFQKTASFPVQVVSETRIGSSYAKNAGLGVAKGGAIAFTDDDCYLGKEYLLKAAAVFDTQQFDYCGGQIWLYDKADAGSGCAYFSDFAEIKPYSFIPAGTIQGSNMIFSRRVVERVGSFDVHFGAGTPLAGEDIEYAARAAWLGFRGALVPDLVLYHWHGRKTRAEVDALERFYYRGAGAYYLKFILKGKFVYLRQWLARSIHRRQILLQELAGAGQYLVACMRKKAAKKAN